MADTQWLTQAQYDLLRKELTERIEIKRTEHTAPGIPGNMFENGPEMPPRRNVPQRPGLPSFGNNR